MQATPLQHEVADMNNLQACFTAAALFAGAAALQPASAASLIFSSSGVFNAASPTTPFSAPGASWSVSFVVDSNPVRLTLPNSPDPGNHMTVPFTELSYQLDGVTAAPALYAT